MRNLLTCPCCNSIPEFKYRAKSELHCTWDDEQYFLPKGWEYSHFCPVDNGLQTSGGVGFQTLHDAQRDWNCKVGSFLRNPLNSFHSSIETGAELLTELDDGGDGKVWDMKRSHTFSAAFSRRACREQAKTLARQWADKYGAKVVKRGVVALFNGLCYTGGVHIKNHSKKGEHHEKHRPIRTHARLGLEYCRITTSFC